MNLAVDAVIHNMENIQRIFREVQEGFPETESLNELFVRLNAYDSGFRSVAFEAASMSIALKDIAQGATLKHWKEFQKKAGVKYDTQVHIGLGWALAQQMVDPSTYLVSLDPLMRYRVMDGYGYYEGIFRKRKSVVNQQRPELTDSVATSAYDQGLGRSIWYISRGDVSEAKTTLESFAEERQNDLWRGIGIAVAFVGGVDENLLKEVAIASGNYKPELATGAAMTVISRNIAQSLTEDAVSTLQVWSGKTADEVVAKDKSVKSQLAATDASSMYEDWIAELKAFVAV